MLDQTRSTPRLLFVDDEPAILDGLRRQYRRRADWDMSFETDPVRVVADFTNSPPNVVVTDLAMPGMSGLDMLAALLASGFRGPAIVLTGTADLAAAVHAINEIGVFRFYTKPVSAARLAEGIDAAIDTLDRNAGRNDAARKSDAVLDRLPMAVFVVDANCILDHMNRAGAALTARRDGLLLDSRSAIRAERTEDTVALRRLVAGAVGAEDGVSALSIARKQGDRPLSTLVLPLERQDRVALFVTDPDNVSVPSPAVIGRLFGLTGAEARIAQALAEGRTLDDAAAHCGIAISTARTYLKSIFMKTRTGRQADLLRLIWTSTAVV